VVALGLLVVFVLVVLVRVQRRWLAKRREGVETKLVAARD
jgi:hypothetical protein